MEEHGSSCRNGEKGKHDINMILVFEIFIFLNLFKLKIILMYEKSDLENFITLNTTLSSMIAFQLLSFLLFGNILFYQLLWFR